MLVLRLQGSARVAKNRVKKNITVMKQRSRTVKGNGSQGSRPVKYQPIGRSTQMLVFSLTKMTATGMAATTPATKRMSELPTALPIMTANSNPNTRADQTTIWLAEILRKFTTLDDYARRFVRLAPSSRWIKCSDSGW